MLRLSVYADKHHQSVAPINIIHHVEMRMDEDEEEEERVKTRSGLALSMSLGGLHPQHWSVVDVSNFLRINDCGSYCQGFCQQRVDGAQMLALTKEAIMTMTGMKVGPSLKIFDLIQQLKAEFKGKDFLK
ncbi:hypothetical protein HPB47_028493 [Ixodes persulcatus]|uniref:Uncharacterized protein n=1 Tax=Ixodes persulcatus TaxID=34615 RepID=A0AC60PT27_IXOPE|nr:hypothetical protein HPB47_028493 [Ixodes persulcatus]